MGIIWTIIIGLIAGIVAKFLHPGSRNEPSGFVLTAILGIVGAIVATYLGQAVGWYKPGEGAGFIGAVVGAIIVLVIWGFIANRGAPRNRRASRRCHPPLGQHSFDASTSSCPGLTRASTPLVVSPSPA